MFKSIEWFARNPAVANLLALLLLVGGFLAIPMTRQETLPNLPLDRIGVVSELPGAAPEKVEQTLCSPLENGISTLEGIQNIRSDSREGVCSITVDVVEGYVSAEVRDKMAARVESMDTLPQNATRPSVEEAIVRNRVARLLVVGNASPRAMHEVAWQIRDQLLDDPAIVDVQLEGLPAREISLEVSRDDLYRYDLTFSEIAQSLRADTERTSGGILRSANANSLVLTGESINEAPDYAGLLVRQSADGERLELGDIATIIDGFSRDAMAAWLNGRPAVALEIFRIGNQDVVDTARSIHTFVKNANLPEGLQLILWSDDSQQYRDRTDLLWENAIQGLILLTIILAMFFGLRLSAWVGAGIPVAMIGACIVLPFTDSSFNTISLFAFILVLGIVVDDAVIVGESVDDQARKMGPGIDAVVTGVRRVALPIFVAVLTTAISFLPMMFLPGPEGDLMRVVPIVAITVLMLSLVESLWILPAHLAHAMKHSKEVSGKFSRRVNERFDEIVERRLMPMFARVLNMKSVVLLGFASMFIFCVALLHSGWLSVAFYSQVSGGKVMIDASFPEGTSSQRVLRGTQTLQESAQRLEAMLNEEYEAEVITDIYAEQGIRNNHSTAYDPSAYLRTRVTVALAGGDEDSYLTPNEVARRWRQIQPEIPGAESMRISSTINRIKPDIDINLFHPDLDVLEEMSSELERRLREVDGVLEITNGMSSRFAQINLDLLPGARLSGMTEDNLGRQVQAALQGTVVDQLPQGDHEVPVVLRLPADEADSLGHLEKLPIRLNDGSFAPLEGLAVPRKEERPAMIQHFDNNRGVAVTAYVDTEKTTDSRVMEFLKRDFLDQLAEQWPGARWAVAGKPLAIKEFVQYLSLGYAAAILAMFFVLTLMFGRYWQPVLILIAIPFGMVGAFLGHAIMGYELTLWSVVGVVAVSGVVVNDNLVLIDHINYLRRETENLREALLAALAGRIRPIMLTTMTTFLAVAPLVFETSPQAAFLIPMAISLGFGVLFASLTTLFMVPSMILSAHDFALMLKRRKSRSQSVSEQDSVDDAYRHGAACAGEKRARNPYVNDVLRASWEAGFSDAMQEQADDASTAH